MQIVKLGDRVRIQYTRVRSPAKASARLPEPKETEFTVGGRSVLPGLSLGVAGMAQGEHKRLTLQPVDAFGPVEPRLIQRISRRILPKRLVLKLGKRLSALSAMTGRRRSARIVKLGPRSVIVDGNHPLAGKVIELTVRMLSVDSSPEANRSQLQGDTGSEG